MSHPVEFHVESAGVADRLSLRITPPEGRRGRLTVSAGQTNPPGRRLTETHTSERHIMTVFLSEANLHNKKDKTSL